MKLLVALLLLAAKPAGPKIAIYPLQASGVSPDIAGVATSLVPSEVQRIQPNAAVTSPDDLKMLLLQQNQEKMMGCTGDAACLAELGGAIGATELVTGRVGRLGRLLVLEMRRLDMKTQRTVASSARTTLAEEGLVEAVRLAVGELYGIAAPATSAVASAPLKLDKADATYDPIQQATPSQPSDTSPDYDETANGTLEFAAVATRSTKVKGPCGQLRKTVAEVGLSVDTALSEDDTYECEVVTKWRSLDLGRRFRLHLRVLESVGRQIFVDHHHQTCSDTGCRDGKATEREAAFMKSAYRALFDTFESLTFK
ncbi:MAG: hypothetical protein WCC48_07785 [Anaeromyxobacteraceae bacterium]